MNLKLYKIQELNGFESQALVKLLVETVNKAFDYQYSKTWVNGLGEFYHFLAETPDKKIFSIGTYANVDNLKMSKKIVDWHITSDHLDTALFVIKSFQINDDDVIWLNKTQSQGK